MADDGRWPDDTFTKVALRHITLENRLKVTREVPQRAARFGGDEEAKADRFASVFVYDDLCFPDESVDTLVGRTDAPLSVYALFFEGSR